nr:hypothetical protein [Navicula tsukamotoi]UXN44525.1 hypothetical protein [Navicula tsukamotoi]
MIELGYSIEKDLEVGEYLVGIFNINCFKNANFRRKIIRIAIILSFFTLCIFIITLLINESILKTQIKQLQLFKPLIERITDELSLSSNSKIMISTQFETADSQMKEFHIDITVQELVFSKTKHEGVISKLEKFFESKTGVIVFNIVFIMFAFYFFEEDGPFQRLYSAINQRLYSANNQCLYSANKMRKACDY